MLLSFSFSIVKDKELDLLIAIKLKAINLNLINNLLFLDLVLNSFILLFKEIKKVLIL